MHPDDADDDELSEFRQPAHPDDRLWRHPSELGSGASVPFAPMAGVAPRPPATATTARPRHRTRRSLAGVAAVAGLIGATTAVGAVVLAGGLRPRIIERGLGSTPASATIASTIDSPSMSAMLTDLQHSVVRVEASAKGVTRQGAAVVVTDELLVTSARLVEGGATITVRSTDALVHKAEVLGIDRASGIAVLEVRDADLMPAPESALRPEAGDTALTMTLGGQGKADVSMGIVSSVGDTAQGPDGPMSDLITIDRPVPVSSDGGALIDGNGKVVGICLVLENSSQPQGHAVPIAVARQIATDIRDDGAVNHAWLGVQGVDLSDQDALELDLPGGGRLTEVTADGPGDEAGLQPGDIVIRMSGREVTSISDLAMAIRDGEPGDKSEIVYIRNGVSHTVTAELGNPPT